MARNDRRPGTHRAPVDIDLGHEVRAILSRATEEDWVLAERECITQAREQKSALMAALNLKGYRHDDHPAVWSRERVARFERRRRSRRGAA